MIGDDETRKTQECINIYIQSILPPPLTAVDNWWGGLSISYKISSEKAPVYKSRTSSSVSSGGLAVKYPALAANGHRFEPSKRSKLPGINFLTHNIVGG